MSIFGLLGSTFSKALGSPTPGHFGVTRHLASTICTILGTFNRVAREGIGFLMNHVLVQTRSNMQGFLDLQLHLGLDGRKTSPTVHTHCCKSSHAKLLYNIYGLLLSWRPGSSQSSGLWVTRMSIPVQAMQRNFSDASNHAIAA